MARLEPVRARLVRPDWALRVPSPAHDLLTPADRRRYVAANPDTFLRVTRGPEDVEPGGEWSSAEAVAASREALGRLLAAGAYGELAPPALYLLRLTASAGGATPSADPHAQIGIVGNLSVDDYEQGVIRVHERVHEHRAGHLADHLSGLRIQSSPITVAHRADPALSALVSTIAADTEPALDFTSADGLRQQVWRVSEPGRIAALQEALAGSPLYVIDGHHRAAAAVAHRRRSGGRDPEADWMLSVVFPADELRNQAFHRVLHGVDPDDLLARLRARFPVRSGVSLAEVLARRPGELALLTGTTWHLVDLGPVPSGPSAEPLDRLDAVRLENEVLQPVLGLVSTRPDGRLTYRVGDPGPDELASWATAPDEALWLMRPVPLDVVLDAADAGAVMPPKSTFFQPKARSGVFLRPHPELA